ncbi:hypothetical protein PRUPE_1G413600 [Prunus persica]|uniref:Uncharacterized protein n=1 Tax=Prunus persica TaxID=3760 RepID=A0A251RB72_PRUPE|nr:hypothetical protein PRUPE_1G413600 [Prunus persica]
MGLRGPGKNSGLNRENPDILVVMIAEKQIMRGGEEDKRDQNERERDGPSKACRGNKWHSATAPCSNVCACISLSFFLFLSLLSF